MPDVQERFTRHAPGFLGDANAPTMPDPTRDSVEPAQRPHAQSSHDRPPFTPQLPPPRPPRPVGHRELALSRVTQGTHLLLGLIETLLAIRVVLMVLAANPGAGFSSFIYGLTAPLVAPFEGVFPNAASTQGNVLDVAALLAMIVYALVAWGILTMARIIERR